METALAVIFMMVGVFGLTICTAIWRGWVLSILWGWFAVPIFGLPPLGIAQAIAVAMIVSFMTHQYIPSKEGDTWMPIFTMILTPLFALLVGWVVRRYA